MRTSGHCSPGRRCRAQCGAARIEPCQGCVVGLFRRRHQLPDPGSVTAPGADLARPDAPSLGRAMPRVQGAATFGGLADLVHLAGTTTFAKEACLALAVRHGIGDGGHIETLASCSLSRTIQLSRWLLLSMWTERELGTYLGGSPGPCNCPWAALGPSTCSYSPNHSPRVFAWKVGHGWPKEPPAGDGPHQIGHRCLPWQRRKPDMTTAAA